MNTLPVQRASLLATTGPQTQWLIEGLWSDQAVGILGGEPKCCKSFLALDIPADRQRLSNTVQQFQPRLLILDPLIRLHRVDENDATQIAALLSFLRQLQRQFQLAVLLVHHARKDSNSCTAAN